VAVSILGREEVEDLGRGAAVADGVSARHGRDESVRRPLARSLKISFKGSSCKIFLVQPSISGKGKNFGRFFSLPRTINNFEGKAAARKARRAPSRTFPTALPWTSPLPHPYGVKLIRANFSLHIREKWNGFRELPQNKEISPSSSSSSRLGKAEEQ
jgi:hypothetical protein